MTTPYMTPSQPFMPNRLVRTATVQTMLAMVKPKGVDITLDEQPVLLDAGADATGLAPDGRVRLLGYYNPSRRPAVNLGLVMVLHGWEGCSHSNFPLLIAQALVEAGYGVFRLNLRDHGPQLHVDPYALNPGLFMGILIDEVVAATQQVALLAQGQPFYIFGASMGGNFALRLAARHTRQPFHNLEKVVAVCPALSPLRATDALDSHPATRLYFRRRWLRSLRAKQELFPELYDFDPLEGIPLVRDMTEWFVQHYPHLSHHQFPDADSYLRAYAVKPAALADLQVRTTILTSKNDPVIPVVDFYALPRHPLLDVQIHPTGGHVGFVDLPARHQLPRLVLAELARR